MRFTIQYNVQSLLNNVLKQLLVPYGVNPTLIGLSVLEIDATLSPKKRLKLIKGLKQYGIEIVDSHKESLVFQIKKEITLYLASVELATSERLSDYLSKRLGYSYAHLSEIFANVTFTNIESFFILKRIDSAKKLLLTDKYTLTEIAFYLNFNNVSHLSSQFKKVTGLTPTMFIQIIKNRDALIYKNESATAKKQL